MQFIYIKVISRTLNLFYFHSQEIFQSPDCQNLIQIYKEYYPEKNASTSILEKNNFIFKEIVQDHEIGDAWLSVKKFKKLIGINKK